MVSYIHTMYSYRSNILTSIYMQYHKHKGDVQNAPFSQFLWEDNIFIPDTHLHCSEFEWFKVLASEFFLGDGYMDDEIYVHCGPDEIPHYPLIQQCKDFFIIVSENMYCRFDKDRDDFGTVLEKWVLTQVYLFDEKTTYILDDNFELAFSVTEGKDSNLNVLYRDNTVTHFSYTGSEFGTPPVIGDKVSLDLGLLSFEV